MLHATPLVLELDAYLFLREQAGVKAAVHVAGEESALPCVDVEVNVLSTWGLRLLQ